MTPQALLALSINALHTAADMIERPGVYSPDIARADETPTDEYAQHRKIEELKRLRALAYAETLRARAYLDLAAKLLARELLR